MSYDDEISLREREQQRLKRKDRKKSEELVEKTILECAECLDRGKLEDILKVGLLTRNVLIPQLAPDTTHLSNFDMEIGDMNRWNYDSSYMFLEDSDKFLEIIRNPSNYSEADIFRARSTIKEAYLSYELISEQENVIRSGLSASTDLVGFESKIGEFRGGYDIDLGDEIRFRDPDEDQMMTALFVGTQGQGKSVALESIDYDRMQSNHKVIDLLNMSEGEGLTRDIEMNHNELIDARSNLGLESEELDDNSDLQILVPMTVGLEDKVVTKSDDGLDITPITIPASDIDKPLLVKLMMSLIGKEQEATVRIAYGSLDKRLDDWNLSDLANQIRSMPDLGEKLSERAISALKTVNSTGFIRDTDSDYNIDLDEVMRDKDTVTVLYTGHMDLLSGKLMAIGYVLNKIIELRENDDINSYPPLTITAREFWKISPHKRRRARDSRASSLQSVLTEDFEELLRRVRHLRISILADTQESKDIAKSIREQFSLYVIMEATKNALYDICSWCGVDDPEGVQRTIDSKPGVCTIVGRLEPTVNRKKVDYVGPVHIAPAKYHHLSTSNDGSGWSARKKYLDDAELTTPERFGASWIDDVDLSEEYQIKRGSSKDNNPTEEFVENCLTHTGGRKTAKDTVETSVVREVYKEWRREQNDDDIPEIKSKRAFGQRVTKAMKGIFDVDEVENQTRNGTQHYIGFILTQRGDELLS